MTYCAPKRVAPLVSLLVALVAVGWLGCKPDIMTTGGEAGSSTITAGEPQKSAATEPYTLAVSASLLDPASPVAEQQIKEWAGEAVTQDKRFRSGPPKGVQRSATLKVDYRANSKDMADGSGQIVGSVFILATLTLRPVNARPEVFQAEAFVGEALASTTSPEAGLMKLARGVAEEIAGNLVAQVQMRHGDDVEVLALLDQTSPEVLALAIEEARERDLKKAAPRLKALLKHAERDVVNRAASALGDLGSRDMVPALIDAGSRVDPVDRLPVLYALGELGGPEAVLYLETLIGGVTDPTVQQAAKHALDRARGPAE